MASKANPFAILNDRKRVLRREMEAMCSGAETEARDFTQEEQTSYEAKKTEFDRLASQLERRHELAGSPDTIVLAGDQGV